VLQKTTDLGLYFDVLKDNAMVCIVKETEAGETVDTAFLLDERRTSNMSYETKRHLFKTTNLFIDSGLKLEYLQPFGDGSDDSHLRYDQYDGTTGFEDRILPNSGSFDGLYMVMGLVFDNIDLVSRFTTTFSEFPVRYDEMGIYVNISESLSPMTDGYFAYTHICVLNNTYVYTDDLENPSNFKYTLMGLNQYATTAAAKVALVDEYSFYKTFAYLYPPNLKIVGSFLFEYDTNLTNTLKARFVDFIKYENADVMKILFL